MRYDYAMRINFSVGNAPMSLYRMQMRPDFLRSPPIRPPLFHRNRPEEPDRSDVCSIKDARRHSGPPLGWRPDHFNATRQLERALGGCRR